MKERILEEMKLSVSMIEGQFIPWSVKSNTTTWIMVFFVYQLVYPIIP